MLSYRHVMRLTVLLCCYHVGTNVIRTSLFTFFLYSDCMLTADSFYFVHSKGIQNAFNVATNSPFCCFPHSLPLCLYSPSILQVTLWLVASSVGMMRKVRVIFTVQRAQNAWLSTGFAAQSRHKCLCCNGKGLLSLSGSKSI